MGAVGHQHPDIKRTKSEVRNWVGEPDGIFHYPGERAYFFLHAGHQSLAGYFRAYRRWYTGGPPGGQARRQAAYKNHVYLRGGSCDYLEPTDIVESDRGVLRTKISSRPHPLAP